MARRAADTALTPDVPVIAKLVAIVASHAPSLINFRGPLLAELRARGNRVLAIAPDFDAATTARLEALRIDRREIALARTGLDPIADWRSVRQLTALFAETKPDVVTGYTPKAAIYSAIAGRSAGVPAVVPMVTGLGYAFLQQRSLKIFAVRQATKALYARAFKASDAVIFQNEDDLATLRGLGLLPEGLPAHIVAGSGVDLDAFPACPLPSLEGGIDFLMIARLVRYKGVFEFCEAARALRARGAQARFRLIGGVESGPAAFKPAEIARFGDAVEYLGPRTDIAAQIAAAHIYVLPSYGEGMPRTVLEALAVGRPVITTDVAGCRSTVLPGVNGTLVPPRDAEALRQAMEGFLKRPDRIAPMAAASRRRAEAVYDVRLVTAATIAALGL